MFLPYCQLAGANVTVDIFTEGMGERAKAAMAVVLLAARRSSSRSLLLRQMWLGCRDYMPLSPRRRRSLHLPLWTAFPPILVSLALLLAAALVTAVDGWRGMRGLAAGRSSHAAATELET